MKTSESIAIATVSLFEAGDLPFLIILFEARQIFVPDCKNHLNVATAMPCVIFTSIHQKFISRGMDEFYRS